MPTTKQKLATKMNNGERTGMFDSKAWKQRKEARRLKELNKQK